MHTSTKKKQTPLLVSACLLGVHCRYDDTSKPDHRVQALQKDYALIPFCPEEYGGLPTPRPPAEYQADGRIINSEGEDVTNAYLRGAEQAVHLCQDFRISHAILKSRSPSCGPYSRYDGSFTATLVDKPGLTAERLRKAGVIVWSEEDLDKKEPGDILA